MVTSSRLIFPGRAINVKLTDEELAARPMTPVTRQREVSKSLKAYASMVSSADKGGSETD